MKPTKKTTGSLLQEKWWRKPGLLYFIAAGDPPRAIKIGVTTQKTFLQRFRQIQSSNYELLKLMGAIVFNGGDYPMKDCEDEERRLHIKFAHLQRFKPHTRGAEWFSIGKDLLSFINETAGSGFIRGAQSQRNVRDKEFKAHEAGDAKGIADGVQRRNPKSMACRHLATLMKSLLTHL